MIKILYANGCSMTEGSELGNLKFNFDEKTHGPNSNRDHNHVSMEHAQYMEKNAYPSLLTQNLNIQHHKNGALSGSSNRRIVRTTINDVEELCRTYDPSEIFVFIGFSTLDRFEYYNGIRFMQIVPNTVRAEKSPLKRLPKEVFKYLEARSDIGNDPLLELLAQHFSDVLLLKQYLEQKNIKFLFSYGIVNRLWQQYTDEEIQHACKNKEISTMFELCEFKNPEKWVVDVIRPVTLREYILECGNFSFFEYLVLRKMHVGNGGHPLEHAHIAWAKHLTEYMSKHKILAAD